jgi:hypothetical protein
VLFSRRNNCARSPDNLDLSYVYASLFRIAGTCAPTTAYRYHDSVEAREMSRVHAPCSAWDVQPYTTMSKHKSRDDSRPLASPYAMSSTLRKTVCGELCRTPADVSKKNIQRVPRSRFEDRGSFCGCYSFRCDMQASCGRLQLGCLCIANQLRWSYLRLLILSGLCPLCPAEVRRVKVWLWMRPCVYEKAVG